MKNKNLNQSPLSLTIFIHHIAIFFLSLLYCATATPNTQEITPYKFKNYPYEVTYDIPSASRFTAPRTEKDAPDIIYYFTKPLNTQKYPIALLSGGSTSKNMIGSIIPFHRYVLQEFLDLNVAVITVEQWGVDGNTVDERTFFEHYTRSQRLKDHEDVISFLQHNPPKGWDGTFVFLGVSEGGPLVTTLTERYPEVTRATINWCGAGDWSWDDELWAFICTMKHNGPWYLKLLEYIPSWIPFIHNFPKTRNEYDACMHATIENPCIDKYFMGMTYLYHADALQYPMHDYKNIKTPFLAVIGSEDPMIESGEEFVRKAQEINVPITYIRVDGMDHYIRKRADIVEQSFEWLKEFIT